MNTQNKNAIDTLLADAFKELAASKPIEKITIREITDRAGVIRPTFYNHFQDKYELLEWIARQELMEPIRPLLLNQMTREGITFVLNAMLGEKEFYMKAVNLTGQNSFEEIFRTCITELILDHVTTIATEKVGPYSWLTPQFLADMYAQNLSYTILEWARNGMHIPPKELADVIVYTLNHTAVETAHISRI